MPKSASILLSLTILLVGGCYYEIRDVRSGKMYYSPDWVAADGYRGPLTFTDHEGRTRRVDDAVVIRLSKRDYEEIMRELEAQRAATQAPASAPLQ